jgi:hypothetical protein
MPPPELPCPVVEQAETVRPMRTNRTAEKTAFINISGYSLVESGRECPGLR